MRRYIVLFLLVIVFSLIVSSIGYAFQNELEGFRGVKWGDPLRRDMKYCANYRSIDDICEDLLWGRKGYDDTLWYKRKNEKLQIGAAKLEYIRYGFYKGQFMEVFISTDKDYKFLEDVVNLKFGHYDKKNETWSPTGMKGYRYEWSGDITTIILHNEFEKYEDEGTLDVYSTKIYNQRKKDRRRKREEETRRKEEERRRAAEEGLADFDLPSETEVPISGEEIEGRGIVRFEEPTYPKWAERQGIEGTVKLKFWVLSGGEVYNAEVLRTSGWSRLDECAIKALRKWRFTSINKPEIKTYNIEFHFSLSPTKSLSVYNVDSLASSELPPVVIQGEDISYLEIIRTKQISYMPFRGEKKKSIVSPLVNVSLPPKIIYPHKMSPSAFLCGDND